MARMLVSTFDRDALPDLRSNTVRHGSRAWGSSRCNAAQPADVRLLRADGRRQCIRCGRLTFPAATASVTQPASQGQTCVEYTRCTGPGCELDLSHRAPLMLCVPR